MMTRCSGWLPLQVSTQVFSRRSFATKWERNFTPNRGKFFTRGEGENSWSLNEFLMFARASGEGVFFTGES